MLCLPGCWPMVAETHRIISHHPLAMTTPYLSQLFWGWRKRGTINAAVEEFVDKSSPPFFYHKSLVIYVVIYHQTSRVDLRIFHCLMFHGPQPVFPQRCLRRKLERPCTWRRLLIRVKTLASSSGDLTNIQRMQWLLMFDDGEIMFDD